MNQIMHACVCLCVCVLCVMCLKKAGLHPMGWVGSANSVDDMLRLVIYAFVCVLCIVCYVLCG
jgi:hypothetical protein